MHKGLEKETTLPNFCRRFNGHPLATFIGKFADSCAGSRKREAIAKRTEKTHDFHIRVLLLKSVTG
jgi:hypothetical protein